MPSTATASRNLRKPVNMANESILQYESKIDQVIARYASSRDDAVKRDLKQEGWSALIEASHVDNAGHAYTIIKHRILNHLLYDARHETRPYYENDTVHFLDGAGLPHTTIGCGGGSRTLPVATDKDDPS